MTRNLDTNAIIKAWIRTALQGEQSAYAQLYDHFAAGLYRLCYGLVLNRQDAEDVVQESFVYAFKNLHRYDHERAAFKTWLYTIAVSRCRNTYRRKHLPTVDLSQLWQLQIAAPDEQAPEAALARRESVEAIQTALWQLSPILREAIVLRYGHGLTYREMSDIMGCPQKTAESRVRLAHGKLKDLLHPIGRGLLEDLLKI